MRGLWRLGLVLVVLATAACKIDLYTGLDEREANEIIAALTDQGIGAAKKPEKDGRITVLVEQDQFAAAMARLDQIGLPRPNFESLGSVFKGEGMISSPIEERARFIYATSQELSRTLSDIDGVLSARIHVVLPRNDLLNRSLTPSSAAVFIRHRADMAVGGLIPQIKMLVSNSIEGLGYDQVSVVTVPAPVPEARPVPAAQPWWLADIGWGGGTVALPLLLILGLSGAGGLAATGWAISRRGRRPAAAEQPGAAPAPRGLLP